MQESLNKHDHYKKNSASDEDYLDFTGMLYWPYGFSKVSAKAAEGSL